MIAAQPAEAVTPLAASPELLAREALMRLADRIAERLHVLADQLVEPGPSRNTAILHARWTFVWAARIVLHAKDWQVAALVGWSRDQVRNHHRALQEAIDVDTAFRDRLDATVRELFGDVEWKRPLRVAVKAHFEGSDGRRR